MSSPNISWTQLVPPNSSFIPRSSHGVSVVGDTVYVFGGEHVARTPLDDKIMSLQLGMEGGNIQCGGWEEVKVIGGTPPSERFGHGQAAIGKKMYVFGGRAGTAIDEKLMNDLHVFDLISGTWSQLDARGPVPSPRSYHRMEATGDFLYVFGGVDAVGRKADLHKLDTKTNEWEKLADGSKAASPIEGRGGPNFAASSDGNKLFVLGGFAGREMDDVHVYQGKAWNKMATTLNIPRSVCVSCSVGGKIVVFGGEVEPSDRGHSGAGGFHNDLEVMEEEEGRMEAVVVKGEPGARGWSAGGVWREAALVVVGGLTGDDENPVRLGDVWVAVMDQAKLAGGKQKAVRLTSACSINSSK